MLKKTKLLQTPNKLQIKKKENLRHYKSLLAAVRLQVLRKISQFLDTFVNVPCSVHCSFFITDCKANSIKPNIKF